MQQFHMTSDTSSALESFIDTRFRVESEINGFDNIKITCFTDKRKQGNAAFIVSLSIGIKTILI